METLLDPGRRIVQKRPSWRSGTSSAATLLTDITLWISLCSTAQTTLIAYLKHPDHRDSSILFLGNPRGLKIRPILGNELRHHCLLYGHGPNATSFIHDNSVPFPNAWNCLFQMMKSCAATKMLSPQEQIISLRGSRWASRDLDPAYGWYSKNYSRFSRSITKGDLLHLLTQTVSTNIFLLNHVCRRDSASTTGTLGPDVEKKMPSKNRLQGGGISLPCRRRPNMLIMTFLQVGSTWPIVQAVRFSSVRTPSIPTSMSNLSTFMTQDETCQIKSWKGNRDGSCKVFFHVPHFVDHQWAARSPSQCFLYISATSTPRRKASPRSSFSLFVPSWFLKKLTWLQVISMVMRSDVAAETASVLLTKPLLTALPTPPGPTPLWWPGSIPDNWADVCGFLKPPGSHRFWKVHKHGAFSIPRKTLGLRPTDQSYHHETWRHLDFVEWSNRRSKQDDCDRHISLKERLAACSHGTQETTY